MKRAYSSCIGFILLAGIISGCSKSAAPAPPASEDSDSEQSEQTEMGENIMNLQINNQIFTADLADTKAASELADQLRQGPIRLHLHEYGGFEKTGSLGKNYTAEDAWIDAKPGDLMLYQGNQISIFYGTNSWSYTPLGQVSDTEGWKEALGTGDAEILLTLPETE